MSFTDDAKELLSTEEFTRMMNLNHKSASFEATADEETELQGLKNKARKAIAQRDKVKNIAFLKTGGYTIAEVLAAMGADKKSINKAVAELFKPEVSEVIGKYDFQLDGVHHVAIAYRNGERVNKYFAQHLKKIKDKEKFFVSGLTDFGKAYLTKAEIISGGPYAGETKYEGITYTAKRLELDKDKLMEALGIKKK